MGWGLTALCSAHLNWSIHLHDKYLLCTKKRARHRNETEDLGTQNIFYHDNAEIWNTRIFSHLTPIPGVVCWCCGSQGIRQPRRKVPVLPLSTNGVAGRSPGFLWKWLVVLELRTDVSWSSRHGERTGTTRWEQEWEKPSRLILQISAFQAWLHLRITENHLGNNAQV